MEDRLRDLPRAGAGKGLAAPDLLVDVPAQRRGIRPAPAPGQPHEPGDRVPFADEGVALPAAQTADQRVMRGKHGVDEGWHGPSGAGRDRRRSTRVPAGTLEVAFAAGKVPETGRCRAPTRPETRSASWVVPKQTTVTHRTVRSSRP